MEKEKLTLEELKVQSFVTTLNDDQMNQLKGGFTIVKGRRFNFRTRWTSVRKVKEGETTNDLFAFLTTEPNAEVGAIHPKAMPVILTSEAEIEQWMNAPAVEALKLQRPLTDGALKIVARGSKTDGG